MTHASVMPDDPHVNPTASSSSLATYQAKLALDRTTLGWIRTTLTMASFGFGMVAFFRTLRHENPTSEFVHLHERAVHVGIALLVVSTIAMILAGTSHWFTLRRLRRGDTPVVSQWPLSIVVAMTLAIVSLAELLLVFL